ncbi:MAG: Fe-S cluster assembly protein SufD [Gammaproteobacteria bacterium]
MSAGVTPKPSATPADRLAERISQEHTAARDGLPATVVSAERRLRAVASLAATGLPTTRDENWKYANLRPVERVKFAPAAQRPRTEITAAELPPVIEGYARYAFVDGVLAPELSAASTPRGVSVTSLRVGASSANAAASEASRPDERFALLNDAFATDGAAIHVAKGIDCAACIEIVFIATESAQVAASYPRVELNVESNAHVGLIERHISLHNDANFVNGAVQVNIGAGSQVKHYRLQQAGVQSTWIDTLSATVAQDAKYTVHAVNLGGLSARSTMHIELVGPRAELALHVVSLADGQQVHDAYALVEHIGANTKSDQRVRGIAAGRGRVGFNSKVVVRKHARGADSRQSLRGLLAGSQAEIDVRPQLEIYTDDVRCSHGATAGKLDDNMLFYMLSRGIEPETAQQLLKWAFLEDVVSRIEIPELRRYIETNLAGQMKETAALKELI